MTYTTDPALPDVADEAGMSVSIYVPDTGATSQAIYSYLRLGAAAVDTEATLPLDPTESVPVTLGATQTGPFPEGAVLYTNGTSTINATTININSPSINITTTGFADPPAGAGISAFSPSSLNAVTNGNDGPLCYASLTTGSFGGYRPANVTFQNTDQMTMSEGASSNFLTGDALTFWTGNDQSTGFGGLLWSNYGFTTNLFGGTIINIANATADLQGFGEYGSYKISPGYGVIAPDTVSLKVAPSTAAAAAYTASLSLFMNRIMAVGSLVTAAYSAGVLSQLNDVDTSKTTSLKDRMTATNEDLEIMTMLVVGVQALSAVLAAMLTIARPVAGAAATSEISLADGSCYLSAGLDPTSTLGLTAEVATLNSTGAVSILAGDALLAQGMTSTTLTCTSVTSVAMTPATLTLTAGPTSIMLGPTGITMNGVQITTNALQAAFAPAPLPPPPPSPGAAALYVASQIVTGALRFLGIGS